jgi:2-hydroxymuconate-semialdehyde hydrolase
MSNDANPEIGRSVSTCGYATNYHDLGAGSPVILLHGSGAGVTGWANWRGTLPALSQRFRCLVPDLIGFGYTERPAGISYRFMDSWVEQIIALMDALAIDQADLVGNSFGGSTSLALLIRHPERFRRAVLMGSGGVPFKMPDELETLWGAKPSVETMKKILDVMAFDRSLVTDELAELRFRAAARPGVSEAMAQLFPPPRQRWLDAQCQSVHALRSIPHEVLVIHGREDRVVPVEASEMLFDLIPRAQLHLFGQCGHWTQIEHKDRFNRLVGDFLASE